MSFLILSCVLESSHQYVLLEAASAGISESVKQTKQPYVSKSGGIGPSLGRVFCLNLNLPLSVRHIFRFLWSTIVRLSLSCTTELGSFTPPIQAGVAVKTHFYWRVHFPLLFSTRSCCCLILRVARLVGVQGPDLATLKTMRKWTKLIVATTRSQDQNQIWTVEKMKQINCCNNRSVSEAWKQ